MRALAVLAALPHPLDEALSIAHDRYLRALSQVAEVTVVTWERDGSIAADHDAVRSWASELVVLPREAVPASLAARLGRRARFLSTRVPHYAQAMLGERGLTDAAGIDRFQAAIGERHATDPFDVIVLGEEVMALAPLPPLGIPVVLHRWNGFGPMVAALDRHSWWRRLLVPAEAKAWSRFERNVNAGADLILAPTPEVAAHIESLGPAAPVAVMPHGVERAPLPTRPSTGDDVAYVGAMNYVANADAVAWFATACWPTVLARHPGSTFRIVGRSPGERVRSLAGPGVDVVGAVEDVSAACAGVRVGVVPLRGGMGIKTKTLEFMAMGLPVVTTPVGAEGIGATPDDGLLVTATPGEMADAVDDLLSDPERADRLGAAARAYVAAHHSWEAAGARYRDQVTAVLAAQERAR